MMRAWAGAAVLAAGATGCSSGGGADAPAEPNPNSPVLLQFSSTTVDVPEGDAGGQVVTLDVELGLLEPPLAAEATVGVRVKGGSATAGDDYQALSPQTLTFAAGSADGAVQQVAVTLLADLFVEGDETVELELFDPTGAASLGTNGTFLVRILDDDAPASLELVATPDSGPAQALSDGGVLDFGVDDPGTPGGPAFLLTLHNDGDEGVDLDPVALAGSGAGEFVVGVEVAPLPPPIVLALPTAGARYAPLFATETDPLGGTRVVLDPEQHAELRDLSAFRLEGLLAPGAGPIALDLERVVSPLNPRALVNVDGAPSAVPLAERLRESTLWRGVVEGFPGSRAYLALSPHGTRGWIRLSPEPGGTLHLVAETTRDESPEGATSRLVRDDQVQNLGLGSLGSICAGLRVPPTASATIADAPTDVPETKALTGVGTTTAAVCNVALETDFQFFQRFGSVDATVTFVDQLFGMLNEQYVLDVQTLLSVSYLSLWTSPLDPWAAPDDPSCPIPTPCADALLDEFQEAWSPDFGAPLAPKLSYDVATFLSGASIGGGIAYVDVLCDSRFNYGVAGDMNTEAPLNWDFIVVAHEIGHQFGALHTHDYCPPLDRCVGPAPDQECQFEQACGPGTIMSYCHLCNNGETDNIALVFQPAIAAIMRGAVDASCLGLPGGASLALRLTFDPQTVGEHAATLSIPHDAPGVPSPFDVGLAGEGL